MHFLNRLLLFFFLFVYDAASCNNLLTVSTDNYVKNRGKRSMKAQSEWCTVGLTTDSVTDLLGHVSDLVNRIRQEAVCLQEVKGAERQQLEGDAHVAVEVEPVQHLHTVSGGVEGETVRTLKKKPTSSSSSYNELKIKQQQRRRQQHTHFLLCGSRSIIFSNTLISSLAASLYFSRFLIIFRAIWLPPL